MQKFLSLERRWLRWVLLFLGAAVLAVALSQVMSRSPSFSYGDAESNPASMSSALSSKPSSNQQPTASSSISGATSNTVQAQIKYDRTLAHYATVSRSDGSFRQMFVDSDSIAAIQPGTPLPDGTLIVMETWYSPENLGTVFVKQKQNGEWKYGSFSPDQPNYQMGFSGSCHSCHSPFPDTDFTLTKPLLEAALQSRQVQTAYCDAEGGSLRDHRAGRAPCNPEAYIPAS